MPACQTPSGRPLRLAVLAVAAIASLAPANPSVLAPRTAAAQQADLDEAGGDYNTVVTLYKQQRWRLAATTAKSFLSSYPNHPKAPLATLYLGLSQSQLQQQKEARETFEGFLRRYPNHEKVELARYRVGEAAHFLGDDAAAVERLAAYLRSARPGELTDYARLYLGKSLVELDRPREALDPLQTLLRKPALPARLEEEGRLELARALASLGRTDDAVREIRTTLQRFPDGPRNDDARLTLGTTLFEAGRYGDAQDAFDALVRERPGSSQVPIAQLNAGYAAYRAGRYDAALARFREAARTESQAATAAYWSGLTQKAAGQPSQAAETLIAAYRSDPDGPLADRLLYQSADALRQAGATEPALQRFGQMLEAAPDSPLADDAYYSAADLAIAAGRLDAAADLIARFDRADLETQLDDRFALLRARLALARSQRDPGRGVSGEEADALAAQLEPLFGSSTRSGEVARVLLARLRREQGAIPAALDALQPVLTKSGGDPAVRDEATLLAAAMRIDRDEPDQAAKLLRGVQPASRRVAALLLAEAEAMRANWDAAAAAVASLPPDGPPADAERVSTLLAIAELAFDAKRFDLSAEWFGRALAKIPTDDAAQQIVALSGLGYSQRELKQHTQAAGTFARLQPLAEGNDSLLARSLYAEALSHQTAGDAAAALVTYRRGVERFGATAGDASSTAADEVAEHAYSLAKGAARLAKESGAIDEAATFYETAARQLGRRDEAKQADLPYLLYEWGTALLESERFGPADAVFKRLVTERPESPVADYARLNLAESRFFSDDPDVRASAAEPLAELFGKETAAAEIQSRAGTFLLDLLAESGDAEQLLAAATSFAERFADGAEGPYADYRRAEALLKLDRAAEAEAILRQLGERSDEAVGQAEWFDGVPVLLTDALVRQKKYAAAEQAAEAFQRSRPDSPRGPEVDELIGRALKNQARFDEARQRLRRVVTDERTRLTETAAKAQLVIADTYLLQEQWDKALPAYLKVYANYDYPEYRAAALYQAGVCDEKQGQPSNARVTYQSVIDEFPDSDEAAQARRRLSQLGAG